MTGEDRGVVRWKKTRAPLLARTLQRLASDELATFA